MTRQNISSGSPFEPVIGFSRAVRINKRIIVSGTAPIAADGSVASPDDVAGQTRRCLEIIQAAIEEAGGSLADVIRTRMFLVNASEWEAAGRAHGEFFKDIRPAATMVGVKELLNPEWLVEIEAECELSD